jgi:hypothetical protein
MCRTREEAEAVLAALRLILAELGLELKDAKTLSSSLATRVGRPRPIGEVNRLIDHRLDPEPIGEHHARARDHPLIVVHDPVAPGGPFTMQVTHGAGPAAAGTARLAYITTVAAHLDARVACNRCLVT